MIVPGLCSVTFRSIGIDDVAALAEECRLGAIEWGADVHVPPGDAAAAAQARAASAGLTCSYGSYLFAASVDVADDDIAVVMDTAVMLGCTMVRVWTPFGVTSGGARRTEVSDRLRAAATIAAERSLTLGLEFHGGTLTETVASTKALLADVGAANLTTYWQPPYWLPDRRVPDDDVADVMALGELVTNVHVYEWTSAPDVTRRPLIDGAARWPAVLGALDALTVHGGRPRAALLEFVADDDVDRLRHDATTLRSWITALGARA